MLKLSAYAALGAARSMRKTTCWDGRMTGLLGLSIVLFCTACKEDDGRLPVFPVSGKVTFENKPTQGAMIVLHPVNNPDPDAPRPLAHIGKDGIFKLTTYEMNDGAPAGEYEVAITWIENVDMQDVSAENLRPLKSFLPERYGKPKSSGLTVEVKEEPNNLPPFELKK